MNNLKKIKLKILGISLFWRNQKFSLSNGGNALANSEPSNTKTEVILDPRSSGPLSYFECRKNLSKEMVQLQFFFLSKHSSMAHYLDNMHKTALHAMAI